MTDEQVDRPTRGRVGQVDTVRASVVVVCFVVSLLLLLPSASRLGADSVTSTTAARGHHHTHAPKVVRSATKIAVVNASGRQGAAGNLRATLQVAEWDTLPASTSLGNVHQFTNVYFTPHFQQAALDLAREIGVPRKRVSLRTLAVLHVLPTTTAGFDVVVLLGKDLAH